MLHPAISADIADKYLENIGYAPELREEMVKGIARHALTDRLPGDMSAFQMSVRDSDDCDRFDFIRTVLMLNTCVNERGNADIIKNCRKYIEKEKWVLTLPRGTKTAEAMMKNNCERAIALFEELIGQAQKGFKETEAYEA